MFFFLSYSAANSFFFLVGSFYYVSGTFSAADFQNFSTLFFCCSNLYYFLFSFLFLCLLHDVIHLSLICSSSCFILPPCTAGSYPHAQQFYYAVDRGVGSTLTYDAPANLPDYSGMDISTFKFNICLFEALVFNFRL